MYSSRRTERLLSPGVVPATLVIFLLFGGGLFLGVLQAMGWQPGNPLTDIGFSHFLPVLTSADFSRSLLLTLYISSASTFIASFFSLLLAVWLTRPGSKSGFSHFLLQIPLTVPHLVAAISILFLLTPTGLMSRLLVQMHLISADSFPYLVHDDLSAGIILVYVWKEIPFITMMLVAVLKNSGQELYEAAATLRCSPLQRFIHITLPLASPTLLAASLIVFSYTFGAFEVPFLLGKTYPVPLPVWSYKSFTDIDLSLRSQGIAVAIIITLAITLLLIPAYGVFTRQRNLDR